MATFKDNCGIGGYLAGLGVRHVDGTEDFKFLDKPVHNMVVDCGLDMIFTNGYGQYEPENYMFFGANDNNINPMGLTRWFAIGTGTTPTQASDTTLENQLGGMAMLFNNNTYKYKNSSTGYWGTKKVSNGHIATRLSVYSVAVPSGGVIGEIGFFGGWRQNNATVSRLFSRIVIPEELRPTLAAGEQLIVTYELNIVSNYAGEDPIDLGNIGIKDGNGDDLGICAEARAYWPGTTNWGNPVNGVGFTSNFYDGYAHTNKQSRMLTPLKNSGSASSTSNAFARIATSNFEFKPVGESEDTSGFTRAIMRSTTPGDTQTIDIFVEYSTGAYTLGTHRANCSFTIRNTTDTTYNIGYVRLPWSIDFKFYKMIDGVKTYYDIPLVMGSKLTFNFIKSVGRLEDAD